MRKPFVAVAVASAVAVVAWARAAPGSGTSSVPVGRATLAGKVKVDRGLQRITFQPGDQSGWHCHPGPVLISVVEGP